MSAIGSVLSPSGETIPIVDASKTGFNALGPEAFLKLMIAQLQNQDPTEPTSNEELLGQISQMRSLQSSIKLEELLESLATSQSSSATASFASSAAALIGHQVTGESLERTSGDVLIPSKTIEGIVDRAVLRDGKAYVGIGEDEVPVEKIERVTAGS